MFILICVSIASGDESYLDTWKPGSAYINGSVQEIRNSIANALELRISSTNPSIFQTIDSANGLLPVQWKTILWTNADDVNLTMRNDHKWNLDQIAEIFFKKCIWVICKISAFLFGIHCVNIVTHYP